MSVVFCAEKKIFKLDTVGSSYVFGVNQDGILVHYYYGAPIDTCDVEYLATRFGLPGMSAKPHYAPGGQFSLDAAPLEYPTSGVADYRPVAVQEQKIKKSGERMVIELEKTPDILGSMRDVFGFTGTLVGFAAETQNVEEYAQDKLRRKKCDFIVANDVSRHDIGFDSRENEVALVYADHVEYLEKATKEHIALHIIEHATLIRRS